MLPFCCPTTSLGILYSRRVNLSRRISGHGHSRSACHPRSPDKNMATTRRYEDIVEAIQAYHPTADIVFIQRAYMYSAKVHAGQVRKSGEPNLIHPLEVAHLLTELRLDEASVVAG